MANATSTVPFESLPIPQKGIPNSSVTRYRIYKNDKEFIVVQAPTALEAFEASGVKNAVRIERERLDALSVLDVDAWKQAAASNVAAAPTPAAAPEAGPAQDKPAS